MENNILKLNIKKYIYFLLVFVISMTVLIVAPMWQNDLSGFHLKLPNSKSGWLAYIVLRTVVSLLNMLIFACFVHQGELNCAENPNKLEADKILNKCKVKVEKPRSPNAFRAKQYGGKGSSMMIMSFIALVALPPILFYDWKAAISYIFTIIMSIVFGIYQMMVTEAYWGDEYLRYAKMVEESIKNEHDLTGTVPIADPSNPGIIHYGIPPSEEEIKIEENKEIIVQGEEIC